MEPHVVKASNSWRRLQQLLFIAVIVSIAAACGDLFGSDQAAFARTARVIVANEASTPLVLVTSTKFVIRTDPVTGAQEVVFTGPADTTRFSAANFDQSYDIFGADRFLARLINPDSVVTATVTLRVRLDEREVYSQRATMRDAYLQYTNFYQR